MGETNNSKKNILEDAIDDGLKNSSKDVINRALNAIGDFVIKKYGEAKVLLGVGFERYLNNATERYNKIRTIATGTEPRAIIGRNNLYEEVGVTYKDKTINTSTVDPLLNISKNILINGTGGIGKTMLMRYLFLNTANRGEYVPVLLELRKISNMKKEQITVLDLIYMSLKEFDVELPNEQFEYSLRLGKYLFLFDGFDEIKDSYVCEAAQAIQSFCSKYPKNPCIITSRPREQLAQFETFTTVYPKPLSKEQAVSLASKIWNPDERTKEFCQKLNDVYFEKYKSFAENPLLLNMMFLTHMHNGSIPEYLADFYKKAFDALYSAHDNRKGPYRRDFACKDLEEKNFKKIFAHFCFQTYFKEVFEFSNDEIIKYISISLNKKGFPNIEAKKYIKDLCEVVCMLVEDGTVFRFSHRSFQAYFAAVYSSGLVDSEQKWLFQYISEGNPNTDRNKRRQMPTELYHDYYNLLYQIEPERFFHNALEDKLREIDAALKSASNPDEHFLKYCFKSVNLSTGYIINKNNSPEKIVEVMFMFYRPGSGTMGQCRYHGNDTFFYSGCTELDLYFDFYCSNTIKLGSSIIIESEDLCSLQLIIDVAISVKKPIHWDEDLIEDLENEESDDPWDIRRNFRRNYMRNVTLNNNKYQIISNDMPVNLDFLSIDSDNRLTQKKRREFYNLLVSLLNLKKKREAISSTIAIHDSKKLALMDPNPIDEL